MGNEIMSSFCCLHTSLPSFSYGYVLQLAVIADNLHKIVERHLLFSRYCILDLAR